MHIARVLKEPVFERIAALRAGKPTILARDQPLQRRERLARPSDVAEEVAASVAVVAAWNNMICGAAEANGFTCADISTAFNGKDGRRPSGELLAGTYTHRSDKGNEVIARVLADLGFKPLAPSGRSADPDQRSDAEGDRRGDPAERDLAQSGPDR